MDNSTPLSQEGQELLEALLKGVDIARAGYEVPEGENVVVTPRKVAIDDFLWTHKEVQQTWVNGVRASMQIPDVERQWIRNAAPNHATETDSRAMLNAALADDRTRADALADRFTVDGFRFKSAAHHIDQFADCALWACWIPDETDRLIVWAAVTRKATGRSRVDWETVKTKVKAYSITSEAVRKRYNRALAALALELNRVKYPRRRSS